MSSVLYKGAQTRPNVPEANNATSLRLDMTSAPGYGPQGQPLRRPEQTSGWPMTLEPTSCMRWVETPPQVGSSIRRIW